MPHISQRQQSASNHWTVFNEHYMTCNTCVLCCPLRSAWHLTLPASHSGPAPAWVVAFVQPHGKTLGEATGIRGCLRHKDALLDPQAALGRMLIVQFTLDQEPFPDPLSAELKTKMLFVGRSKDRNISYAGHSRRDKELYKRLGIMIKKVTHAPRLHAAREADDAGLTDEVGRMWRWLVVTDIVNIFPGWEAIIESPDCCSPRHDAHLDPGVRPPGSRPPQPDHQRSYVLHTICFRLFAACELQRASWSGWGPC